MDKSFIIVVEGKNDIKKIKELYKDIIIYQTSGLGIQDELVKNLAYLEKEGHKIILLLDPDFPGERIRNKIASNLKKPYHIYLDKELCLKNGDIGVENISKKTLKKVFDNIIIYENKSKLLPIDLYNLGLIGQDKSRVLREKVCKYFHIGHSNSKSLYKKLYALGIEKEKIKEVLSV